MGYYRGDGSNYYRGDYYRGDPFLGAALGIASRVGARLGAKLPKLGAALGRAFGGRRGARTAQRASDVLTGIGVGGMAATGLSQGPTRPTVSGPGASFPGGVDPAEFDTVEDYLAFMRRKRRRMNPLNPKALRRALRRARGFEKFAKKTVNAMYKVVDGRRVSTFKKKSR